MENEIIIIIVVTDIDNNNLGKSVFCIEQNIKVEGEMKR